ncbi:hypothetical protein MtrunA17_Chr6g0452461 [Medicago truncatula]|uniref:Uncharacterized protein n=1 Tax=Medicago truncatula TaxID=3880 RepID=A0A396H9Q7_MEDTR|nr:hypothetical protein MtrunA17_Chr6g0452461 [Medicago truncatula]
MRSRCLLWKVRVKHLTTSKDLPEDAFLLGALLFADHQTLTPLNSSSISSLSSMLRTSGDWLSSTTSASSRLARLLEFAPRYVWMIV